MEVDIVVSNFRSGESCFPERKSITSTVLKLIGNDFGSQAETNWWDEPGAEIRSRSRASRAGRPCTCTSGGDIQDKSYSVVVIVGHFDSADVLFSHTYACACMHDVFSSYAHWKSSRATRHLFTREGHLASEKREYHLKVRACSAASLDASYVERVRVPEDKVDRLPSLDATDESSE